MTLQELKKKVGSGNETLWMDSSFEAEAGHQYRWSAEKKYNQAKQTAMNLKKNIHKK